MSGSPLTGYEWGAPDLARLADVTYRQIDHWTRLELLPHRRRSGDVTARARWEGSGNYRRYPTRAIGLAAVLGRLSASRKPRIERAQTLREALSTWLLGGRCRHCGGVL